MLNRQLNSCCWWTNKLEEMWSIIWLHIIFIYHSKKFKNPSPNVVQHPVFCNWFFILISWSNFRNRYSKCVSLFNILFSSCSLLFDIGFNSGMKVHQYQKDDKCDTVRFFFGKRMNWIFILMLSKNSWKRIFFVALMDHLD